MLTGHCHCGACRWTFDGPAEEPATACSCTLCRRYGTLWFYGWKDAIIRVEGPVAVYNRADMEEPEIDFLFCPTCAGVLAWRGRRPRGDGRTRMAVNLRLAEPEAVADLPVRHFDGHDSWTAVERPARTVGAMWF